MKNVLELQSPPPAVADGALPVAPGEIVLGTLAAIDPAGRALVSYTQAGSTPRIALSTLPVLPVHVGRQVALSFIEGDLERPLLLGFIYSEFQALLRQPFKSAGADEVVFDESAAEVAAPLAVNVEASVQLAEALRVNDKRLVIEAEEQLVLQCGESSITLTKAGKIVIRGNYLVSRSTGVNRILGGAVNIN